jgi:hypothetical protein
VEGHCYSATAFHGQFFIRLEYPTGTLGGFVSANCCRTLAMIPYRHHGHGTGRLREERDETASPLPWYCI